jgi:hypothetical protein
MNYLIGKQKCPKCGRFRVLEHPADHSINVGEVWRCKQCEPGRPSTPEERAYYESIESDPRRLRVDKPGE